MGVTQGQEYSKLPIVLKCHADGIGTGCDADQGVCCEENMRQLNSDQAKAFSLRMPKPGSP